VFDIGSGELVVLGVAALLIFGPERLPTMAAKAGRALRELRGYAATARRELSEQLGPELRDIDLADLNPRTFVRRHLWDDEAAPEPGPPTPAGVDRPLAAGERPPYDPDAT